MSKSTRDTIANPTFLKPFAKRGELLRVVVETPKGSRKKYAFDPDLKIFALKKTLPEGMVFPYDFGFVPHTEADDGDPVDALVLMDEPAFPGCMLKCRLIGVIEGEQEDERGKVLRNDRLLTIEQGSHSYEHIKDLKDVPRQLLKELGEFFVNYHKGAKYRLLGTKGPEDAHRQVEAATLAA